jgi:hypothetical protein
MVNLVYGISYEPTLSAEPSAAQIASGPFLECENLLTLTTGVREMKTRTEYSWKISLGVSIEEFSFCEDPIWEK